MSVIEQAAERRLAERRHRAKSIATRSLMTAFSIRSYATQGFHTMTLFGLDMPFSLFTRDGKRCATGRRRDSSPALNQWLEEPLEDCLARARDGSLCLESKSPVDIEESLGMYRGNIFQDAPTWPFATRKEQAGTWGVETEWPNVFLCGSSALRGGAVSGIPGHNAAMKVPGRVKLRSVLERKL